MFSSISSKQLNLFFTQFKPLSYKKKEVVLHAEEYCNNVFYVKEGYLRAYRVSEEGEELTLAILKSEDFFPITWGADNMLNHYYLEALTPIEVLRIPQETFLHFIKSHPDVFYELAAHISIRFGGLLTRMEYLMFGNAYSKVAATLLVCAKRFGRREGKEIIINLPLTHKDIANLVGITRETTCLEMKKLEKKGAITHRSRLLIITDMKKLEQESLVDNNQDCLLNNSL